ncbi:MAG TPA: 50S ribosomal protein L29 [Candidatus Saccharimonadales bacterium]|nr:50S ribosomal protein L29 [Candidatus Saccharimonadales bacterium]
MPILRKREMKQLLPEERQKRLMELRTELVKLRTSVKSGGNVENVGRIRELKRTIARIITTTNQKEPPS